MPIQAAAIVESSLVGGGTILCSHRYGVCSRQFFLSLNRPSSTHGLNSRVRSSIFVNQEPRLSQPRCHLRLKFITRAADSTQPSSAVTADKSIVSDEEFSLAKVSFGVIGLGVGITLLSYGFGAYFNILPGSEWSAIMLTYGFPLAIIGMALKYAELKPVPCLTYSDAEMLREKCATSILKQVRNDVIRYRYGDEQHLDEALKRIFQYGQGGGIPRRNAPILQMIREELIAALLISSLRAGTLVLYDNSFYHADGKANTIIIVESMLHHLPFIDELPIVTEDGKYCLVLVFEGKALQLSDFEKRQAKFASFFGPGITAEVGKGEKDLYEVRLISNTTP